MSEWQPIESAPCHSEWAFSGPPALLYSPRCGVQVGNLAMFPSGPRGRIPGYHGDAVSDWGVTHWMPLPEPPKP